MSLIWAKYMQIACNDMAQDMKTQKVKLSKDYFNELPSSRLENIDDFKMFENFASHDTIIEINRAVKFQVLKDFALF